MAVRGDNKATKMQKLNEDSRRHWPCPHPYCFARIFGHRRDLQDHFQDDHKCGRCNAGKHHKCRKGICGCGCRWEDPANVTIDVGVINRVMDMAFKMAKIDRDAKTS